MPGGSCLPPGCSCLTPCVSALGLDLGDGHATRLYPVVNPPALPPLPKPRGATLLPCPGIALSAPCPQHLLVLPYQCPIWVISEVLSSESASRPDPVTPEFTLKSGGSRFTSERGVQHLVFVHQVHQSTSARLYCRYKHHPIFLA